MFLLYLSLAPVWQCVYNKGRVVWVLFFFAISVESFRSERKQEKITDEANNVFLWLNESWIAGFCFRFFFSVESPWENVEINRSYVVNPTRVKIMPGRERRVVFFFHDFPGKLVLVDSPRDGPTTRPRNSSGYLGDENRKRTIYGRSLQMLTGSTADDGDIFPRIVSNRSYA